MSTATDCLNVWLDSLGAWRGYVMLVVAWGVGHDTSQKLESGTRGGRSVEGMGNQWNERERKISGTRKRIFLGGEGVSGRKENY